jgi:hypothetical protein
MTETPSEDISDNYQIVVEGHLDEKWSARMAGLSFDYTNTESISITTLTGKVTDQSELNGVLNALHNNRMKVLSVLKLP